MRGQKLQFLTKVFFSKSAVNFQTMQRELPTAQSLPAANPSNYSIDLDDLEVNELLPDDLEVNELLPNDQGSLERLLSDSALSLSSKNNIKPREEATKRGWVQVTKDNMHQLKPADVLEIYFNGSPHTILIENISKTEPETVVTAFHYGWHRAIKTIVREDFVLSGRYYCRLQLFPASCCYSPEVVLQRAESRLNDQNYGRMASNSGQFARWCKTVDSAHLGTAEVPIYLSDEHPLHTVKENDHINLKFSLRTKIHGEVKEVTELGNSGYLLSVLVAEEDWKKEKIPSVNKSEKEFQADAVLKTIRSQLPRSLHPRLGEMSSEIRDLTFRQSASNKTVAQTVVSNTQSEDKVFWLEKLHAGKPSSTSSKYEKVTARDLRPGDIICTRSTHRVVLRVMLVDSSEYIKLETLQYSIDETANESEHREIRYIIRKHESDVELAVHNDIQWNCPLYGGGSEMPTEKCNKVEDQKSIELGSTVSFKQDSPMYVKAVVVSKPKPLPTAETDYFELDVILYSFGCNILQFESKRISRHEEFRRIIRKRLEFKKGNELYTVKYNVPADRQYKPAEVVKRAMSRLGEKQFDLQWNSSRDFARWCSIRHASNREQCCVPVESAEQLLEFGKGHIKFQKFSSLYTHDAILREAHAVDGCQEVVRVRMYENNGPYRKVRIEALDFSSTENIRRVKQPSLDEDPDSLCLQELKHCTFLNSNDDFKGSVGKGGSKVSSKYFCYWLRTIWTREGLQGVRHLLGSALKDIQKNCEELEFDEVVEKSDLRLWDHIVLKRRVHGDEADVHFVITKWDSALCVGEGVTFEFGTELEDKGVKEFHGFLRISTNSGIEKVVHNLELDWEKIDVRFKELNGDESYALLSNNCEHLVNFLIYGRRISLQLMTRATQIIRLPSGMVTGVSRVVEVVEILLKGFATGAKLGLAVPILRWVAIAVTVLSGGLETFLLRRRQIRTGTPENEFRQRVLNAWFTPVPGMAIAFVMACKNP